MSRFVGVPPVPLSVRFRACGLLLVFLFPFCPVLARDPSKPRLPLLTQEAAWQRLPGAPRSPQTLPSWARMLAGPLPLTTARMLELDALHRSGDRLDARLRALARWAAADANRCPYSKATAAADFRRAGGTEDDLRLLQSRPEGLSELDRRAVRFARQMMLQAHSIPDSDFRKLVELAGEQRVVALVALLAHASFQDRVLLALNPPLDTPDPLPPVLASFSLPKPPPSSKPSAPPPLSLEPVKVQASSEWLSLQEQLQRQRQRKGRIRIPSPEEVVRRIGENHPATWQSEILWSRVCYGFQPELTDAWFACVQAFRQESKWDPIFSQSIFWIVTRTLKCFY